MEREKVNVLGVYVDKLNFDDTLALVIKWLSEEKTRTIFTVNPEIIVRASDSPSFLNCLNHADLVTPDGIGVVVASKILGQAIEERVTGYDLQLALFERVKDKDIKIFFLGAAEGVAEDAARAIRKKYKGISIVGTHNGFFKQEDEKEIIEKINQSNADILLVGLGMEKQETFIMRNKKKLNAKILMGVGGSFDGFSGRVKRAGNIWIKLNLEWLYRAILQPERFIRLVKLPVFLYKVFRMRLAKD